MRSSQIKVVEHRPYRRSLYIASAVIAVVAALLVGYAIGQNTALTERRSSARLDAELQIAEQRLEQLNAGAVDAELAVQVQREAASALRKDLTIMHDKNAALAEEVTFYKSLMAPSSLPQGLQIAELALESGAESGEFRFQLLLTQIAKRRSYILGDVRVDVVGRQSDAEVVLSLTELSNVETYPLPFRFRYFQDFAGLVRLPDDFTPERVMVTAQQKGEPPMQASFDWHTNNG